MLAQYFLLIDTSLTKTDGVQTLLYTRNDGYQNISYCLIFVIFLLTYTSLIKMTEIKLYFAQNDGYQTMLYTLNPLFFMNIYIYIYIYKRNNYKKLRIPD